MQVSGSANKYRLISSWHGRRPTKQGQAVKQQSALLVASFGQLHAFERLVLISLIAVICIIGVLLCRWHLPLPASR
jgi:hypothetical protein